VRATRVRTVPDSGLNHGSRDHFYTGLHSARDRTSLSADVMRSAHVGKLENIEMTKVTKLRDGVIAEEIESLFLKKPALHAVDTDPGVTLRKAR